MRDEIIVKRYAEAFIGFAKETTGVEKALRDLGSLKNIVIRDNPEFLGFLKSPEITFIEKCDFMDKVLKKDFSEEIRQFLKLLLEKDRIDKIIDIAEYARVKYSHGEKIEVLLKTAFPLDLELIKEIKETLETKFRKKIKFYIDLDGSLLGGVQVIIGHTVIDGSVRRRLDELKEKLMGVRV
jgi:F-type H+-transporting ATPase subunit delta